MAVNIKCGVLIIVVRLWSGPVFCSRHTAKGSEHIFLMDHYALQCRHK